MFVGSTKVPAGRLCFSLVVVTVSAPVSLKHMISVSETHTYTRTHTHARALWKPSVRCLRVEICTSDLVVKI